MIEPATTEVLKLTDGAPFFFLRKREWKVQSGVWSKQFKTVIVEGLGINEAVLMELSNVT